MTIARKKQIDNDKVGYYHIYGRCVRRAWLCGVDKYTGQNFEYRKIWIQKRVKLLSECLFVEVGAYALMSNHMHLVVKNRPDLAEKATDLEVAKAYLTIYPGRVLKKGQRRVASEEEIIELSSNIKRIEQIREKMSSISFFMKSLNEYIARQANREDGCKGKFWESRFWVSGSDQHKCLL